MTCVWTGLINALKLTIRPHELLKHVQENNQETEDITWNGEEITKKMKTENVEWIKSIKESEICHGYDCSVCDPLLFLVAQLYNTSIYHNYNGTMIKYINKKFPNAIINVTSDRRHFRHC